MLEDRVAALEIGLKATNDKLVAAQVPGFGPVAPVNGSPGVPTSPSGTVLPWNEQAGEARRLAFQGDVDFALVPTPGYTGSREIDISQLAPQYDTVSAKLDDDPTELAGGSIGHFRVYFADGAPRTLKIRPQPGGTCGFVQIVGGA